MIFSFQINLTKDDGVFEVKIFFLRRGEGDPFQNQQQTHKMLFKLQFTSSFEANMIDACRFFWRVKSGLQLLKRLTSTSLDLVPYSVGFQE